MNDMDFDMDETLITTYEEIFDEEDYADDVRPAWLSAELMNLDAETQIGFNSVYSDR